MSGRLLSLVRRAPVALLAYALAWSPRPALAETTSPATPSPEYSLKAACLANFSLFVEWPAAVLPDPADPVVIGVWGENPFGTTLEEIAAEHSRKGRPVRIVAVNSPAEAASCHIVFLAGQDGSDVTGRLSSLAGRSILTVGETADFLEGGGLVRFVVVDNRVRFAIASKKAAQNKLRLSSRLLALALEEPDP